MRRHAILLVLVLVASTPLAADEIFAVTDLAHKIVETVDEDGDILVSFKATVRNLTETTQEATVWIQGLDRDDFEVVEARLVGRLKGKESRVLSDSLYIKEKTFKSVARWQIDQVEAAPGRAQEAP